MLKTGSGREAFLKQVVVETTRRCNLRCIHCKVSPENNEGNYEAIDMSLDVFEKVLPFLRKYKPWVQLSGHGETLLHRHLMQMIERTVLAGCPVKIQTSGTLLRPSRIDKMIRLGVASITFSLDAATKELFEKIRRRASFEKVTGNIMAVGEARERLKRPVHIGIEFVAMRMNIHELPDLVRLAARLGAADVQVADLLEYNLTRGQSVTAEPSVLSWIQAAEREAQIKGIGLRLPSNLLSDSETTIEGPPVDPDPNPENSLPQTSRRDPYARSLAPTGMRKACTEPWDSLVVRANGEVLPCCQIHEPYGDLSKQSFEEIWSNEKYQRLRSALLSTRPFEKCVNCSYYGWEAVPPRLSASAPRRAWNGLMRRLRGAPEDSIRLSDGQLFWLLRKLKTPDVLASYNRICQGRSSVTQSCLQLLEGGNDLVSEEYVNRLYRRLFDREPDRQGFAGHLHSLQSGTQTQLSLLEVFLTSEEFREKLPPAE